MKHVNLTAYDTVEDLARFSQEEFEHYCDGKIHDCQHKATFIEKNAMNPSWEGKIFEIGSGNSKLLFVLEEHGLLKEGIGCEISRSRHLFAEKFKEYKKSVHIKNLNADVLCLPPLDNFDLIIGFDVVFQLIAPIFPEAEKQLISWMTASLKPGGKILLELNDFSSSLSEIQNSPEHAIKHWQKFPDYDPFEYVLENLTSSHNDLFWDKIFIQRNSSERSHFSNVLRNYTTDNIVALFPSSYFECAIHSYWNESGDMDEPYGYILCATRRNKE